MKNEGLKEIGKSSLTLANLVFVVFFLNNYLQNDSHSIFGIILTIYAVVMLYYTGYVAINKGDKDA